MNEADTRSPAIALRVAVGTFETVSAGVAIAVLNSVTAIARLAVSLEAWVFLFLSTKPLVDLTWRFQFFKFSEQEVNIQALLGLMVIAFTGAALLWKRNELVYVRPVVALCLVAALSVVVSPSSWGLNEIIRLYASLAFYFTAGLVLNSEARFERFAKVFLCAVSVPVILSYLQTAGALPYEYWDWIEGKEIGRVSGTYQHPLGLVYYFVYAVPLALYLWDKTQQRREVRVALAVFFGLSLGALYLTYHRGGLIAILGEIAIWLMLTRKNAKYWVAAGALGTVAVTVVYANVFAGFVRPFQDLFRGGLNVFDPDFLRGRGINWFLFLYSYYSGGPLHWLIGKGGSVAEGFVPMWGFYTSNEPHNDFIRILHAYGLIGLGLYCAILARIMQQSRRLLTAAGDFSRSLGRLGVTVVPSVILLSITTEPMRYPAAVWYLAMLGSVIEVRSRLLPATEKQ